MKSHFVSFKTLSVNGFNIFYREAGDPQKPAVLLLHGFPTSSHMFRNLIMQLAGDFHVIAPDLRDSGFPIHQVTTFFVIPSRTWPKSWEISSSRSA